MWKQQHEYTYTEFIISSFDCSHYVAGQKLLRKADFHLGQHVNTFFRIRCKTTDISSEKKHLSNSDKRHITMLGEYYWLVASTLTEL